MTEEQAERLLHDVTGGMAVADLGRYDYDFIEKFMTINDATDD